MMQEPTLEPFAQPTPKDILKYLAPITTTVPAWGATIAFLASLGLESSVRLHQKQQHQAPPDQTP
jgi:hypothetical protein